MTHTDTKLNAVDSSTKASTGPINIQHWNFVRGYCFYPPATTPHRQYIITAQHITHKHTANTLTFTSA